MVTEQPRGDEPRFALSTYQAATSRISDLVDEELAGLSPREQLGLCDHLAALATTRL